MKSHTVVADGAVSGSTRVYPGGNILAFFRLQRGREPASHARFAVATDAPLLLKDRCALLGGAMALGEFLSRGTDRDIQSADFFRGWRASHAICGRLGESGAPQEQRNRDNCGARVVAGGPDWCQMMSPHRNCPRVVLYNCRIPFRHPRTKSGFDLRNRMHDCVSGNLSTFIGHTLDRFGPREYKHLILLAPSSRLRCSKRRSVFVSLLRSLTKAGAPKGNRTPVSALRET